MTEEKKNPNGRPTKFEEWMIEDVVELGRKGFSMENIASKYDVTPNTLMNWGKKNPKFFGSLMRAKNHCISHMILLAKENLDNRNYQPKMWETMMRFVHGCKDSRNLHIDYDEAGPVQVNMQKVIKMMCAGQITPQEAETAVRVMGLAANMKIDEIESRLDQIQIKLKNS